MSERRNSIMIGAFVLGGIGLIVAGILLFGTGKLFGSRGRYILYFEESVTGLGTGAPVQFRGVRVGTVVDVLIGGDLDKLRFWIPVIAEIDPPKFGIEGPARDATQDEYHQALIDKGLRAQLKIQSLLTSQMMVHLDFYPDRPANMVPDDSGLKQIPTIPSATKALMQILEDLPLQDLVLNANRTLDGLERLVNAPQTQALPETVNEALLELQKMMRTIEQDVNILSSEARAALETTADAVKRIEQMWTSEGGSGAELVRSAGRTLRDARVSLKNLDAAILSINETASDERTFYQLHETLRTVGQAAESLRLLTDYLGRHPEALLRGRRNTDGEGR